MFLHTAKKQRKKTGFDFTESGNLVWSHFSREELGFTAALKR